jgi:hypothetical protein
MKLYRYELPSFFQFSEKIFLGCDIFGGHKTSVSSHLKSIIHKFQKNIFIPAYPSLFLFLRFLYQTLSFFVCFHHQQYWQGLLLLVSCITCVLFCSFVCFHHIYCCIPQKFACKSEVRRAGFH